MKRPSQYSNILVDIELFELPKMTTHTSSYKTMLVLRICDYHAKRRKCED